jgi:hypothetical protein
MMTHETMFRVCPTFMCLDAKTFDRMLDPPPILCLVLELENPNLTTSVWLSFPGSSFPRLLFPTIVVMSKF